MKIVKIIACLVVIICMNVALVQAQQLRFGAKAGINVSNHIGDMTDSYGNRTALHIGGLAEYPLQENIFLAPELIYSMQGSKQSGSFGEDTYKIDYLNIPVMVMFYPAENISISAGPQLGILLRANVDVRENGSSYSVDIKEHLSGIDFGLNIGAGYQLETGLFFQGRYNLGLSNVFDTNVDISQQNSVFQISVGYLITN